MGYLEEKEKSILFSALTREERVCKEHGYDDLVKICKRLTHIFSYNRFENDIRNKTISEFSKRIIDLNNEFPTVEDEYGEIRPMRIEEMCEKISEQMKRGN